MNTIVVLGSGFDIDLGLGNSFSEYSKNYLNPMCGVNGWGDFENKLQQEVVDWYKNGMDEQRAKKINLMWTVYKKNLSNFFTIKSDKFRLDTNKCAYKFLEALSNTSKIYTFNYTTPYDYVKLKNIHQLTHLHGRYYRDTFKKYLMVMSQGDNMILGIDNNCIPAEAMINPYIYPLAKKHQLGYIETNLQIDLLCAENVIFFGFSMCKVDYGYFKKWFDSILYGRTYCKNIYYITYRKKNFKDFCNRLITYGVNQDVLSNSVALNPIYTVNGSKDEAFSNMLKFL